MQRVLVLAGSAAAIATAIVALPGEAVAARSAPPKYTSGSYKGSTDQGGPVAITVKGSKVTTVYVGVVGSCFLSAGGTKQFTHTFNKSVPIKRGGIEFHMSDHDFAIDLSARIYGRKITGKVQAAGPPGCLSPKLHFSATTR